MKIFVAYGYNERDRWVRDLVLPIIGAFGAEVATGEELQGEVITDAVRRTIDGCDALIAFVTKREQLANGRYTTHRWVTDELAHALQRRIWVVEVRDREVDAQGGIAGDRQLIWYDEKERDKCLVELVQTIGRWCREGPVRLQLLPQEFVEAIRPWLRRRELRCTYIVLEGSRIAEAKETQIVPITGGLFITAQGLALQAYIQIHVEAEGQAWTSDFEPVNAFKIHLKRGEG